MGGEWECGGQGQKVSREEKIEFWRHLLKIICCSKNFVGASKSQHIIAKTQCMAPPHLNSLVKRMVWVGGYGMEGVVPGRQGKEEQVIK